MSLRKDLIKHTIFLQRVASAEKRNIVNDIKNMVEFALQYAHPYTNVRERRKAINEYANNLINNKKPDEKLYAYERSFIRKLMKKHANIQ